MKIFGVILGYLYILVLLIWSIAIPQFDYLILEDRSTKLEIYSGEAGTLDQLDEFYLLSQGNNHHSGSLPGYGQPDIDQFFDGYPFPDIYWKSFRTAVLSFLEVVNIQFEATDIIFPFHFFL